MDLFLFLLLRRHQTIPTTEAIVKEKHAKHVVNQAEGAEAEVAVAVIIFEGKKHITGVIAVNKYNYLTKYLGSLYFILYYNIVIIYKS